MAAFHARGSMELLPLFAPTEEPRMEEHRQSTFSNMPVLAVTILQAMCSYCMISEGIAEKKKDQWELSVRTEVEWPALPKAKSAPIKPAEKGSKEKNDDEELEGKEEENGVELVTERTMQAILTGELRGISGGLITFIPVLTDREVSVPVANVSSIRKLHETVKPKDGEEPGQSEPDASVASLRMVTFRSGSSLPGRLIRASEDELVLSFGQAGELSVPLAEIASITPLTSRGAGAGNLPKPEGRHVAKLTTGEVITGNIAPVKGESDRLTISSPILSGEFPLILVESLLFPERHQPIPEVNETDSNEVKRVAMVGFQGGASLASPTIQLEDERVQLEVWKGVPFEISADLVQSIVFLNQRGTRPNGPILLWGWMADSDDEFEKTRKAMDKAVIGRELIVLEGDEDKADFDATLQRSSTLVIGEWESFNEAEFDRHLAGEGGLPLGEQLQTFVSRGGIAIFLGISGSNAKRIGQLGLGEITSSGSVGDGSDLELTGPGEGFASVLPEKIQTTNSTARYTVPDGSDWIPFVRAATDASAVPVVGRRIGSGWVFLMGCDFYETNEAMTRILIELARYRR